MRPSDFTRVTADESYGFCVALSGHGNVLEMMNVGPDGHLGQKLLTYNYWRLRWEGFSKHVGRANHKSKYEGGLDSLDRYLGS